MELFNAWKHRLRTTINTMNKPPISSRLIMVRLSPWSHVRQGLIFLGMTDSGSHGAGDDSETLTPLLAWGSAIRSSRHSDVHVEQADLCPLMAFFLGLDYPVNSVGRIPIDYLSPVDEDLIQGYLQNARQLLEQVHQQHDVIEKRLLWFKPYPLDEESFFRRMQSTEGFMNVYQIKDTISGNDLPMFHLEWMRNESGLLLVDFMKSVANASHYYHTYRRFLLSLLIIAGFLTSLGTIFQQLHPIKAPSTPVGWICKIVSIFILILFVVEQSPWTHLLYPALVCVHTWLSTDFAIHWLRQTGSIPMKSLSFWQNLIFVGLFLQTFILPFFYRWTMSIGIFLLFLNTVRRWHG